MAVPLHFALADLAAVARIRGDEARANLVARARALVENQRLDLEALRRLLRRPPSSDVDPDALALLRQIYDSDVAATIQSAAADLPSDLKALYENGVLTIAQIASLHDQLNATSISDLAAAVDEHRIRSVPDLGDDGEKRIAAALPGLRDESRRISLNRAFSLTESLLPRLRALPGVEWAVAVGSVRRAQETVGDIELVAAAANPAQAIDEFVGEPTIDHVVYRGARRVYVRTDGTQIGVRFPAPPNAGATVLHLTGSIPHFRRLRARAAERGWRLGADGLYSSDGNRHAGRSEEEIYRLLDLEVIPPEIRHGDREIEAAATRTIPAFLEQQQIQGDLHMHTHWSDGRDSIDTMVATCRELGYKYIAITDHSESAGPARTLSRDAMARQADDIAAARERFPDIEILHGCEVDILPDGRLAFSDSILERLDIVLASLHDRAGHSAAELLARYRAAIRHPLVSLITHPTNRHLPHRDGYDLDYDRLFELAVDTQTWLEIDGGPGHLDMDGQLARRAVAAGATVAVNSDCHRADLLGWQMHLGVLTARRGWVDAQHVVNTQPVGRIRSFIANKRAG